MHLPSVCEGTISNLHRSLVENSIEGGDHIEGGHHFCSLLWLRILLQAMHTCFCHRSQRGTSQGKGEKILKPCGHQSCKKTQVKNLPPGPVLPAYSARSPYHVNHSICRLLFFKDYHEKSRKPKKLLLLLDVQFSSLHSCSSRELTPLHWASWLYHSILYIILLFNSWLHYAVTTLQKRATALQVI